jgi:4-carboxymuconolactone decarboxylase|tara:strand:- start:47 stop:565 length:519 start_codon:yes stop_codon:yes gene_type:complete
MTARQQEIYDAIAQNRSTGVAGPFGPWLANPELAQHAQMLGKTCRYDLKSYDLRHSELVILMVAMHTNAPTEWAIHVVEARRAGLEENIIEALQMYGAHMPTDVKNVVYGESQQDRAIADFASELLLHNRVTDATYEGLHECVGDVGCVELVGLVGYYGLVSLTLNAFEIEP